MRVVTAGVGIFAAADERVKLADYADVKAPAADFGAHAGQSVRICIADAEPVEYRADERGGFLLAVAELGVFADLPPGGDNLAGVLLNRVVNSL